MKLGCHTLQWGMAIDKKERYTWDGTERGITLSEVLRDIAKLKFAGFECTDNDVGVYSADVQGFRRAVKKSGVEFVSTWSTVFPKKLPATFRSVVNTNLPMCDPSQYLPISIGKIDKSKTKSEVEAGSNDSDPSGSSSFSSNSLMLQWCVCLQENPT